MKPIVLPFIPLFPPLATWLLVIIAAACLLGGMQIDNPLTDTPVAIDDPLSATDHLMATQLAGAVSSAEWLGVLAPIAISPFFGIACLCFLSQYCGSIIGANNFISNNPVLQEPLVLWIFVALTVVTSLPRLTKVSKPAAQAIDQLETRSAIITILVIKVVGATAAANAAPEAALAAPQVVQMGMFSFTADALLSVAAVVNILVINTIKFFFEVMIWLTPFPFVDAMFEAANKAACAGLMAVYAWSPPAATILNLILFAICAVAFFRVKRRVGYLRAILVDPIYAMFNNSYGDPKSSDLVVFPQNGFGPFPAKAKLRLAKTSTGWRLCWNRFLLPGKTMLMDRETTSIEMDPGLIVHKLLIAGDEPGALLFTRRYSSHLHELADQLSVPVVDGRKPAKISTA